MGMYVEEVPSDLPESIGQLKQAFLDWTGHPGGMQEG